MKHITRNTLTGLTWLLAVSAATAGGHAIKIHDPWIQEAPPVTKVLAAYMTLENTSGHPLAIAGSSSPAFERVEIHKSEVHEGMAKMKHQKNLEIPPRGRVEFKPGGYHFMLMGRKRPLRVGDKVELTLSLSDGTQMTITADVRKPMGHGQHDAMDHSKHEMGHDKPDTMEHSEHKMGH